MIPLPCLAPPLPVPQVRGSRFVKYQECKVQESPDEVPQGSTPRSVVVHLRGGLTRSVKAGDSVSISGIFLPEPYTGPQVWRQRQLGAVQRSAGSGSRL